MALSVRTRFEVFKRDNFTCQYCGQASPVVVLEVDHIVPVCEGGTDDIVNLRTSCWACNSGKAGVPLDRVVTGEDPHDRAVVLLEKERQLREYNEVLATIRVRKEAELQDLVDFWLEETGRTYLRDPDRYWLMSELDRSPAETIRSAMLVALQRGATRDLRYVAAVCRNWRQDAEIRQAQADVNRRMSDDPDFEAWVRGGCKLPDQGQDN